MTFIPRPAGTTLRRVQDALVRPHGSRERFDPEFPVALRCGACGKLGHGPRSQIREAMAEHQAQCPARHRTADQPKFTQILYPRI